MLAEDEGLHVTFSAGLETAHGIAIVVGIVVLGLVITHIDLAGAAINRRRDFNAYSVSPLPDMSEKIFDTTVAGHHQLLKGCSILSENLVGNLARSVAQFVGMAARNEWIIVIKVGP